MFYNTFTLMPSCFFNKLLTSHLALVTHENMVKFTALEDPWTSGCILWLCLLGCFLLLILLLRVSFSFPHSLWITSIPFSVVCFSLCLGCASYFSTHPYAPHLVRCGSRPPLSRSFFGWLQSAVISSPRFLMHLILHLFLWHDFSYSASLPISFTLQSVYLVLWAQIPLRKLPDEQPWFYSFFMLIIFFFWLVTCQLLF